jgi:hypothetical protein
VKSMLRMSLVAGAIFVAELLAVVAVVGSLFVERWLGVSRGVVLDFIFVVAVSYVPASWIVGTLLMRSFNKEREGLARAEHPKDTLALCETVRH